MSKMITACLSADNVTPEEYPKPVLVRSKLNTVLPAITINEFVTDNTTLLCHINQCNITAQLRYVLLNKSTSMMKIHHNDVCLYLTKSQVTLLEITTMSQ